GQPEHHQPRKQNAVLVVLSVQVRKRERPMSHLLKLRNQLPRVPENDVYAKAPNVECREGYRRRHQHHRDDATRASHEAGMLACCSVSSSTTQRRGGCATPGSPGGAVTWKLYSLR